MTDLTPTPVLSTAELSDLASITGLTVAAVPEWRDLPDLRVWQGTEDDPDLGPSPTWVIEADIDGGTVRVIASALPADLAEPTGLDAVDGATMALSWRGSPERLRAQGVADAPGIEGAATGLLVMGDGVSVEAFSDILRRIEPIA